MQVYSVVVSDHSLAYHQLSESIWIQDLYSIYVAKRPKQLKRAVLSGKGFLPLLREVHVHPGCYVVIAVRPYLSRRVVAVQTTNPMTITYWACWLFCCVLCGFL